MNKLVTIAFHGEPPRHGAVEEHLGQLLSAGWRIVSMAPVGAAVAHSASAASDQSSEASRNIDGYVAGWLAVLLEKR